MSRVEYKQQDFSLEVSEGKDGRFTFTATSLTEDFEKIPCQEVLAKDSINKHLIWRHLHPIQDENKDKHIYGVVLESNVVDGRMITKYEAYDHTQKHKDFIDFIKEKKVANDPTGVSMRYRKYYEGDKIVHLDVFEHSVTPYPKCEECLHIDEYIGEKKIMPDKKDDVPKKDPEMVKLEEHLKKIDDLQKSLDSKTETLEGYKSRIETLESDLKSKDSSLETTKQETKTLEDRMKEVEVKNEDLRKEVDYLSKKPILDELFELRTLNDKEKEFYKSESLEGLNVYLKQWESESAKPTTKTLEKSANESQDESNEKEKFEGLTEDNVKLFTSMFPEKYRNMMLEAIKK